MNAPTQGEHPHGRTIAGLLAFVAGFVDTVGFLALLGLFTAHVTGNFVLLGAALVDHHHGVVAKLLALPVFVLTIAVARIAQRAAQRGGHRADLGLLLAQAVLLGAFLAAGIAASPINDADAPLAIVAGMLGVAAMALQNAASRTVFSALSPTTVMTGNVTQFTLDLVDVTLEREPAPRAAIRARIARSWPPVASFALGAIGGGLAYAGAGFACLGVPIVAVLVVMGLCRAAPVAAR